MLFNRIIIANSGAGTKNAFHDALLTREYYQMKEFVLNNWFFIIYALFYVIAFTIVVIRYFKAKKKAKTTQELADAREELKSGINSLIQEAEKFSHFKGEEKKNYVMTRAIQLANGLMSNEELDNYIEEQVALTDTVNKHNR